MSPVPSRAATAVFVTALVAAAGIAGATAAAGPSGDAHARQAQNDASPATITVTATGEAETDPDAAVLRLAAVATADSADAATRQVAENASELREALLAANLSDEQVRTVGFDVVRHDREPRPEDDRRGDEFVARHTVEVTVEDTSRAGEIIDVAVESGAAEVQGVTFTLSEEARERLREEALREAVADSRDRAEVLADAADLTVTGVRSVSTGDQFFNAPESDVAAADAGGTVIDPGPVSVTATVTATYNATESG